MTDYGNLASGFADSWMCYPERPALEVSGQSFSYHQLGLEAYSVASVLTGTYRETEPLVAIFARRSITAYAGILGILYTGKGYVPLNPSFPIERNASMLIQSKCRTLIVGNECLDLIEAVLALVPQPIRLIIPHASKDDAHALAKDGSIFKDNLKPSDSQRNPLPAPTAKTAYLLFTSGSTGNPKGVPVSHGNALSYLTQLSNMYDLKKEDRFSQFFELTFDLSVHDMFLCWKTGACLCVLPQKAVLAPSRFIKDQKITVWFSVPSAGMFLARMRMLKPNSLPSLRISLFCGEALPATLAEQWQKAAPHSVVDNLYGPTEATISISSYRWNAKETPSKCINGVVPIGWVYEGQKHLLADGDRIVGPGEDGELCLGGSQVVQGYYNNPEKTGQQFVQFPNMDGQWYRTGDLAREGSDGCLYYLGRLDNQIQIRGYRVELQEVDYALRAAAGTDLAVTVAWPLHAGRADNLIAFICGEGEESTILHKCQKTLPNYMLPSKIHFLEEMPLNASGKIDRKQLIERLDND